MSNCLLCFPLLALITYSCPAGYIQCATVYGTCVVEPFNTVSWGDDNIPVYSYIQSGQASYVCTDSELGNPGGNIDASTKNCCKQSPWLNSANISGPVVGIISCGQSVSALIDPASEEHYWKLTTTSSYDITVATCVVNVGNLNTKLMVYSSAGLKISTPFCSNSNNCGNCSSNAIYQIEEKYTLTNQLSGTYYIKVKSFSGDGFYDLTVTCANITSNTITSTSPTTFEPTSQPTTMQPSTTHPTTILPTTNMPTTYNPTTRVPTNNPIKSTAIPTQIPTENPTVIPTNKHGEGGIDEQSTMVIDGTNDSDNAIAGSTENMSWIYAVIAVCSVIILVVGVILFIRYKKKKHKENGIDNVKEIVLGSMSPITGNEFEQNISNNVVTSDILMDNMTTPMGENDGCSNIQMNIANEGDIVTAGADEEGTDDTDTNEYLDVDEDVLNDLNEMETKTPMGLGVNEIETHTAMGLANDEFEIQ